MYTREELETALTLQARLATAGLDNDYGAIRVQRVLDRLSEPADALAEEIISTTPEKFVAVATDNASTFHDELRRRIDDEKAAKRGGEKRKSAEYYDQIRAKVRAELAASPARDLAAELDKITGRRQ